MLASVATFALEGVESREVTVEVDVRPGLPVFTIVGLPDPAVREARERVRAALLNCELGFPLKRLTANLAPADLRKAGPSFDLALAIAVLGANGELPRSELAGYAVSGELSLSGRLRPVRGTLAVAFGARRAGYRTLVVPVENAPEAALVEGLEVLGVPSLDRLVDLVHGRWRPPAAEPAPPPATEVDARLDFADVRGQQDAKRALEIAAAGGHNVLMVGPPGAGKTMLARRLPGVMPAPSLAEAVEITQIQSVAGVGDGRLASVRPFRAPHHTTSASGLVGGGSVPRPGEVTLAHRGVLFLDEIAEFPRAALEALRQPLEEGRVDIVRAQRCLSFPAETTLVAACNRCPCARGAEDCSCTDLDHARYARRLSGPLLDRIDLVCELDASPPLEVVSSRSPPAPQSPAIRARVEAARERQRARLEGTGALCNARMDARLIRRHVPLTRRAGACVLAAQDERALSARGQDRVLRTARTIADLTGSERVKEAHFEEALAYRLGAVARAAA